MNAEMLTFREIIIDGLIKDVKETKKSKKTLHYLQYFSDSARQSRKRCQECYRKISIMYGRKYAALKAKRVTTYCRKCENEPPMCLKCFKNIHKKK